MMLLAFGDSITCGEGEVPSRGWVARVQEYMQRKDEFAQVYNLGVSGDTVGGVLQRIDAECRARIRDPNEQVVIVLAVGINDSRLLFGKPKTQIEKFDEYMHMLLQRAKHYTPHVLVLGLTPVAMLDADPEDIIFSNERVRDFSDVIAGACAEHEVAFLALDSLDAQEVLVDGVHPNSVGYDMIASLVLAELRRLGYIE